MILLIKIRITKSEDDDLENFGYIRLEILWEGSKGGSANWHDLKKLIELGEDMFLGEAVVVIEQSVRLESVSYGSDECANTEKESFIDDTECDSLWRSDGCVCDWFLEQVRKTLESMQPCAIEFDPEWDWVVIWNVDSKTEFIDCFSNLFGNGTKHIKRFQALAVVGDGVAFAKAFVDLAPE